MAFIISYCVIISIFPSLSTNTAMLSLLIIPDILSIEVFKSTKGNGAVVIFFMGWDLMDGFSISEFSISLSVILPITIPFWVTGICEILSDFMVLMASKTVFSQSIVTICWFSFFWMMLRAVSFSS